MKFEIPRSTQPGETCLLTKHEIEAKEKIQKLLKSRPDYKLGILKLDFKYEFSSGEVLKASEDEKGIAHIFIKNRDETVVNFSKLLPPGYKFVTPSYLIRRPELLSSISGNMLGDAVLNGWLTYPPDKIIIIGDMQAPSSVFALLHEMGHTYQEINSPESLPQEEEKKNNGKKDTSEISQKISNYSEKERNAWFRAIQIARQIKREKNINLFEIFKEKKEFIEFMYGTLLTHKVQGRLRLAYHAGEEEAVKHILLTMFDKYDTEDTENKFLEGFFDKGRLRPKKEKDPETKDDIL
ncbi:MAG: hypothetical protein WC609_03190 [Candidatus Paceibacterota bacterium]|jgi:hypothetical protein